MKRKDKDNIMTRIVDVMYNQFSTKELEDFTNEFFGFEKKLELGIENKEL